MRSSGGHVIRFGGSLSFLLALTINLSLASSGIIRAADPQNEGALAGVSAPTSATGRYVAHVVYMIKDAWSRSTAQSSRMGNGKVVVGVKMTGNGRLINAHVVSRTADKAMAALALHAVATAHLPPMPAEVATKLEGKLLPLEITFDREPVPPQTAGG